MLILIYVHKRTMISHLYGIRVACVFGLLMILAGTAHAQLIVPKEVPAPGVTPSPEPSQTLSQETSTDQPVVALLLRDYQDAQFYLLPLSVMDSGQWGVRHLEADTEKDPVVLKDGAFAERLLAQKFYCPFDTSMSFAPAAPGQYRLIDRRIFSLKGILSGKFASTKDANSPGIVMINRPVGWRGPTDAAKIPNSETLLHLTQDAALEAFKRAGVAADMHKYGIPEVRLAVQFDLGRSRKAYWIHFLRPYPQQAAPPAESYEPPGFPRWSIEHFVILEETVSEGYRLLWQATHLNANAFVQHCIRIIGLSDADGDGTAELVLLDKAHEFISYDMLTMVNDKLQKTASVSAAL